ncbi:MAG: hypothetical protein ACK4SF_03955 [Algoriphagus aquaeductus]|uniref:Uncharacterized protein n=1 Tax=Algoriphagus aquaeductus TaxID=475299 RepID=A0A326RMP4_9BACT|nr:hypothetical protein [Algoriphagus aquaeductus]PZV80933.1 hypothetical protein CLV31_11199 [Algoriphagus aquaeductus]
MNLIPHHTETLVSPLSKEEVLGHLMRVTREVNFLDSRTYQNDQIKFNGMVGREGFRISRAIKKGETFLPLLIGKLENTPRGSIIFLEYRLFPSALFFLIFWSIVLLAFSAFYLFFLPNLSYSLICLLLAIGNYGLGLLFFNRQYRLSREVFHQLINFQLKDKD